MVKRPSIKFFGIGLNKTGTRSVAQAMRLLGFRTLHKGDSTTAGLVEKAARNGEPLLTRIGTEFDAYFDVVTLVNRFRELDEQYPGSRFILTTRSRDDWHRSRERHALANQERAARGDYAGAFLTVDHVAWEGEWDEHHRNVLQYFTRRPDDLLVIDVCAGDGWEKVAPFCGRPIPRKSFPWENRSGVGTYHVESAAARLRRRTSYALARLGVR